MTVNMTRHSLCCMSFTVCPTPTRQAAEVGLPPATLLRNLVNMALRRGGVVEDLQLPMTPPSMREGSMNLLDTESMPTPGTWC